MTQRLIDHNGWLVITDNPITKEGVFEYLGKEIGAPEPDKIYKVYRPAEEIEKAVDTFKSIPFRDEHKMLGKYADDDDGKVDAIITDEVYFDPPYLKGNIKVFNKDLKKRIENGKTELSAGYRSSYDFTSGTFNGERYDAIQRNITGNHLALVDEGRAGPDVAVQDQARFIFTIDSNNLVKETYMSDEKKTEDAINLSEEARAGIAAIVRDELEKIKHESVDEEGKEEKVEDEDHMLSEQALNDIAAIIRDDIKKVGVDEEKVEDEELPESKTEDEESEIAQLKGKIEELEKAQEEARKEAMDSKRIFKEISDRNALAEKLKPIIGVFDYTTMDSAEVAQYGLKKLSLTAPKGAEVAVLDAYLSAKQPQTSTQDKKRKSSGSLKDAWIKKGE